jgi:F0F1-type ATP synthase assembly protein I
MPKPVKTPWKAYGRYGSLGIELILSMAVGYYVGRWLDGRLATAPWLALAGFVVGVYAGFRQFFRAAKRMTEEAEREDEASGDKHNEP